jgi:hypothetical protein
VLAEVADRRSISLATVFAAMTPAARTSLEQGLHAFREAYDGRGDWNA